MTAQRRSVGWTLAWILIGVYLSLKLLGWWYGIANTQLRKQIESAQTKLSDLNYAHQLEKVLQACTKAVDQTRDLSVDGALLLQRISQEIPPALSLEQLRVTPEGTLILQGSCQPGRGRPEPLVKIFAEKLTAAGFSVEPTHVLPDAEERGLWRFELRTPG